MRSPTGRSAEVVDSNLGEYRMTPPPLWEHQKRALHFLENHDKAMLYMGMGTGKTRICIEAIQSKRILVICPKSVIPVWPEQIQKHSHNPKDWRVVAQDTGTVSARANSILTMHKNLPEDGPRLVAVINYESVLGSRMKTVLEEIPWNVLILDESHRIKSPGGKQSRYISRLAKKIDRRIALTGTPLPQGPLDAYAQFRAIDPNLFGFSFTRFRAEYAVIEQRRGPTGTFPKIVGFRNLADFERKFFSRTIHVSRDELELPDAEELDIPFSLSGKERSVYSELEKEFYTKVESGEITVANALVKILRLSQVASGFVRDDADQIQRLGESRKETFADVLEDTGQERVVVFARFHEELNDIHAVCAKQKRPAFEFSGRRKHLSEWRESADGVLVCQIQAAALGLDFTAAAIAIYYSPTWSLADYEQSVARVHRPGQKHNVSIIRLKGTSTVDIDAYGALRAKASVVESILERRHTEAADEAAGAKDPYGPSLRTTDALRGS